MRIEILKEWFFPVSVLRVSGRIIPAPPEAVGKLNDLRENWLLNHPRLPKEEPMVTLDPGEKEGQDGYFVRTQIIYKS